MTKKEYEDYYRQKGEDLMKYGIFPHSKTNRPDSIGCFFENGLWHVYKVGERQNFWIAFSGSEEEAYEKLKRMTEYEIAYYQRYSGY